MTYYFPFESNKKAQTLNKHEFLKLRKKYYNLSINDRLEYMNKDEEGIPSFVISNTNGEKLNLNKNSKKRNLIEKIDQ